METHSLKISALYLPSQVERYWTINLWSDKQWQRPYYLHMTLRSPKNAAISCDTGPNNVSLVQGKKIINVKKNILFGSPHKLNLYSHYTHFPQQYSISLSMSCTLCVLTQMQHELKWREANTILQNRTFGETVVHSQPLQSFTVFISPANSLFTN